MQYLLTICEYGTKAIDNKLNFLQVYFVGIVIFRTFAFELTTSLSKRGSAFGNATTSMEDGMCIKKSLANDCKRVVMKH